MKSAKRLGAMMSKGLWVTGFAVLISIQASAQGVGGRGGGGFDKVAFKGCEEGRQSLFTESDPDNDRHTTVLRTCTNGSYYDLSDYIYDPQIRCKEGLIQIWHDRNVWVQCVNGRWEELR